MRRLLNFRRDVLTPLEAAGERALRAKKRTKRDDAARAKALSDFEAAKTVLGPRFGVYARSMERLVRKHIRDALGGTLPVRDAPTVASVFGRRKDVSA